MNIDPNLTGVLKKLRLSGVLDSLNVRNTEAIKERLAYTEFLSLLLHDEVARREQKKYATRQRRSGLSGSKTLDSYDFDYNPTTNRKLVYDLVTCGFVGEPANVLIAGPCGTGKSHLAQAIGNQAIKKGLDVQFITLAKLLTHLHAGHATGVFERRFRKYTKLPLLIIDDFGLKPIRPPFDEYLHELISDRYENTPTVITSNLDFEEWLGAFENKLLGAACVDRIRHNAYVLTLEGKSFRTPKNQ
jgi:DNA replication protein DnaC